MSRLRQLGKDSVIYGIGGILSKGVGFLLLPVYTRIFSPADYGVIEMLTVIASFLTAFLVMGMDSAQSFYFFQQKEKGKSTQAEIVSAILQWRLLWGGVIVVLATLFSPFLSTIFFRGTIEIEFFAVAFVNALLVTLVSQSIEIFRLLYRPWPYIGITLSQTILTAILILYFVLFLDKGIFGYFLGGMVASFSIALFSWYLVRDYIDFKRIHFSWWKRVLRFGIPLLPAGIAIYIMNASDRWFLQFYHNETLLGVYAVGAKFALIMALAMETFRKAWWPIALDAMHSKDGPETFQRISRLFMGLGVLTVVYLTFLSPWLVKWLTPEDYHDAWYIVGLLAWQSLFYGFYLISSAGIWKCEKTHISMYIMLSTALLNLVLNWLLVPAYGGIGAALSTSLSYLLLVIVSLIISERLWQVHFPINIFLLQIGVGILTVAWLLFEYQHTLFKGVSVHLIVLLLLITIFNKNDWKRVKERLINAE